MISENVELQRFRLRGDLLADNLAEAVLAVDGRLADVGLGGYNELLTVLDQELSNGSSIPDPNSVKQALSGFPEELTEFFLPEPESINLQLLVRAQQLWQQNQLTILGVLYARSLPACYLLKNGVPALYDTARLTDQRFIFQRVYETGLFLDSVLSQGGLQLLNEGDLEHGGTGRIWGRGFIEARKVRFLHASMRLMLQRPDQVRSTGSSDNPESVREALSHQQSPWHTDSLGVPINQLDMAYTLLAFGYLIPEGLGRWGNVWGREDRWAFMHLWTVVGRVMGIEPELIPGDLDQAADLYGQLVKSDAGESTTGVALTSALMSMLTEYLPPAFGLRKFLSALLIEHQLGREHAAMIVKPPAGFMRLLIAKTLLRVVLVIAHLYFGIRNSMIARMPVLGSAVGKLSGRTGRAWISTWRDAYDRSPFTVPGQRSGWRRKKGYDSVYGRRLQRWRDRFFWQMLLGFLLILVSPPLILSSGIFLLLFDPVIGGILLGTGALTLGSGLAILRFALPWYSRRRPRSDQHDSATTLVTG